MFGDCDLCWDFYTAPFCTAVLDNRAETPEPCSILAQTRSDVTDCEVSLENLDGDDSCLDFLSSYYDLAPAAPTPSSSSPSRGDSQSFSPQVISINSSSPTTQRNFSHSVTPQQVQARACELCRATFDHIIPLL